MNKVEQWKSQKHGFFVLEVQVKSAVGDSSGAGDILGSSGVVAVVDKQPPSRIEQFTIALPTTPGLSVTFCEQRRTSC